MRKTTFERLMAAAKELRRCVDFDVNGQTIGQVKQGGNGGLISIVTLQASDGLARAIDAVEEELK